MKSFFFIAAIAAALFLQSFTSSISNDSGTLHSNHQRDFAKRYFAVCGKCNWVSPRTESYSDASSMGSKHYQAQEGTEHRCTTVSHSPESEDHYISVCGKCNWTSPEVDTYSDASSMGSKHYQAQEGTEHRCTTVKQ